MVNVSQGFKDQITKAGKQKEILVTTDSTSFNVEQCSITTDGNLFKTIMRTVTINSNDCGLLTGQEINVKWGLKVDGSTEFIDFGNYIVRESSDDRNRLKYELKCCDYMIKSMVEYRGAWVDYPCTLLDYLTNICVFLDIEIYNTSFFNSDLILPQDYFEGLDITYRDVLDQIAEVTCSTIFIKDNKLYLSQLNDTGEVLDPKILVNATLGEEFRPLNSFVLARSPQIGDDVYRPTTEPEDVSEIAFTNNDFLNQRRDEVIDAMFAQLVGMTFWTFSADELGAGYFEPCDLVTIQDREGNTFKVLIMSMNLQITNGSKENIGSKMPVQSTTRYQYATTIQKAQKRTEIVVDKLENTISAVAEQQDAMGMQIAQLLMSVDGIGLDVRARSGMNLLLNSVGFNGIELWTADITGSAKGYQDNYISNNTTSRSAIRIVNGKLSQTINTIIGNAYAITFKYRKSVAQGWVTWTDGITVNTIFNNTTANTDYVTMSTVYVAQSNECTFEFGSTGDFIELSDTIVINMSLRPGEVIETVEIPWSPNPNEVYGTNIFIDAINGMTIYDLSRTLKNVLNSDGMAIVNTLNGNVLLEVTSSRTFIDYLQTNKIRVGNSIQETSNGWTVFSLIGD